MKKQYVLGMTLMASLAFASCSKDEPVVQEGNGIEAVQNDGQVLTLQVSNSGDGLTTRAGRPLLSSEAKQDINTIDLFVVNDNNKVVLKKTISANEWANALDYGSTTAGHGKQLQISFKGSEEQQLPGSATGTEYTIYAVAYKTTSNYATTFGVSDAPTTTVNSTPVDFTETYFATTLTSNTDPADEIFAGKVSVKVVVDGTKSYITTSDDTIDGTESPSDKKVPTLVLNRQVAGVTGYFTNIPVKVGEYTPTTLRLIASGKSNKVHFTSMLVGETDDATDKSEQTPKNIVNGSQSETLDCDAPYWKDGGANATDKKGYKVYDIDLSQFFVYSDGFSACDLDNDGFVGYKDAQYYVYKMGEAGNPITFEDLNAADTDGKTFLETTWADAISGNEVTVNGKTITANSISGFWKNKNTNQTLVAGSVFAGEFIIPFLQNSNYNTFELQLLDKDGNILKNWNVQVPEKIKNTESGLADGIGGYYYGDSSKLIYNIYRNHLYSLGIKTTDVTDPTDPENPDPDPKPEPDPDPNPTDPDTDDPVDLSNAQDLLLNVNDNWEMIHQMEID